MKEYILLHLLLSGSAGTDHIAFFIIHIGITYTNYALRIDLVRFICYDVKTIDKGKILMLLKTLTAGVLLLTSTVLFATEQTTQATSSKPKLILQITVDQLRGDLPDKFMKNMGDGGFRWLKKNGLWYKNANYTYSNTETVVCPTTVSVFE